MRTLGLPRTRLTGLQDFFLSVLGSSATKRDARAYLQKFTPPKHKSSELKKTGSPAEKKTPQAQQYGVNLGSFYGPRAVNDSPRFIQHPPKAEDSPGISGPLHVALVKIRAPQHVDDDTLSGVARTLSQLGKLGLSSTVVVDCDDYVKGQPEPRDQELRLLTEQQADRIVTAIDAYGEPGARKVDNIIGISEKETDAVASAACVRGRTHVKYRKLLMAPLRRGIIPVIPAIGYADTFHQILPVKADDVVLALTREFAGFHAEPLPEEDHRAVAEQIQSLRSEISLDRLIVLDPLGGIPTAERPNGYHVFLNLEQEFSPVKKSLFTTQPIQPISTLPSDSTATPQVSDLARGNPFSRFVETELRPSPGSKIGSPLPETTEDISSDNIIHLQNLELVRRVLSLLPPSSSALLTTLAEAANSEKSSSPSQAIGVGTRRQRNPLIHNLLTDKPVYSSSLPAGRLGQPGNKDAKSSPAIHISPTTFAKRGMSVSIFPDPRIHPWKPCTPGQTSLTLTDSRIDLPRLVHLIDDSFNRKLDVQAYLNRINDRIAGVIIAGEYEGGALLTWETPPGVPDDGSEESRARMVPYLDKFAVLKRSQGAGGVADILFKTMVKDSFPEGVCWRSRKDNPVNKWYFERSRGTWKIRDTNWTMFWTTPDLDVDQQKFADYEGVCRSIIPSWADNKAIVD
jgi:amino-acid N-acetyltransferase